MKSRILICLMSAILAAGTLSGCAGSASGSAKAEAELINVSYDPTREFYKSYNQLFRDYWLEQTGQTVNIVQSHGGSGKQALEVANGLEADVATLALEDDLNAIVDAGLLEEGFTSEFENDSAPYTSAIVLLVRAGNPKDISDWDDLLREDVDIVTPNPKTSGGARWNYLAAWYYFEKQGLSEAEIEDSMKTLYENVVVLDSGSRGSTTSFVENGQGDVLVAWENEAFLCMEEYPGEYEIVIPSVSIYCQPTVAVIDEYAQEHGTEDLTAAYLSYLYSDEAQELAAENYYRPCQESVLDEYVMNTSENVITEIPEDGKWINANIDLVKIDHFGGWDAVSEKHFSDGGIFDAIYEK